jgi:hypothetical protein
VSDELITNQPFADPAELTELGIIQEVNRRLLHPLGLALGYWPGRRELVVLDGRDDPEGVRFEGMDLAPGRDRFEALWAERAAAREAVAGFVVQPVEDEGRPG